jgi:hypothetical protein
LSSSFQVIDRTLGISRMTIYTNGNVLIPGNLTNSGSITAPSVRIGSNYAADSTENLRIVRGLVTYSEGTLTATGTGFTVVRNGAGNFTITFSPAFTDANPTMTVTPAGPPALISVVDTGSTSALAEFYNTSGTFTDPSGFYFIVVGTP